MSPAPPGPRERGAHPAARGRRARPSLAPGRCPQATHGFHRQPGSRGAGDSVPCSSRPARRCHPRRRAAARHRVPAGRRTPAPRTASPQPPHLGRSPRAPQRRLWPVRQPRQPGRARAGPAVSPGSEAAGAGAGAQMTGRSRQRGGGRLRVFVLGEEAESPITRFVYSTQTQFVTSWLCLGGGILTRSNLRAELGGSDMHVAGDPQSEQSARVCMQLTQNLPSLLSGHVHNAADKVTDRGTTTEHTNRLLGGSPPPPPQNLHTHH